MPRLTGLYAITPAHWTSATQAAEAVAAAIAGGARVIQYRDKSNLWGRRFDCGVALHRVCSEAGVPLIINDDLELCMALPADGVHLGRGDADPVEARAQLGPRAIIGVSCYNDWDRALTAQQAGASYIAFGSFHPSPTKPDAVRADQELLARARRELLTPTVAIGGITPENGRPLIEAGADMLAVISGVFNDELDPLQAAARYAELFPETP